MKEYEDFKKECLRIQKEWGLGGWEIMFDHYKSNKAYAYVNTDNKNHKAMITFTGTKDDWTDMKKTAKHEMLHIVLARLTGLAEERYTRLDEIIEAEEEVVQILLKLLTQPLR